MRIGAGHGHGRPMTPTKRRALFTLLALTLLVLAVGGWVVQGLRFLAFRRLTAAVALCAVVVAAPALLSP